MNTDMHAIMRASRKAHDRTVALDTAVEMVLKMRRLQDNGVIDVSNAGVHLTQDAFDAMPWGDVVLTDNVAGEYTRSVAVVDDVAVFCLSRNNAV